jgi:hypothetical protein
MSINYKRRSDFSIIFDDYPQFRPNLTPNQIFQDGAFGGTYFRPISSSITNKKYKNQHKEFEKYGWFDNLDIKTQITSEICRPSVNKHKVKAGSSLKAWEESGWIEKIDPYGWFQWYCRFYTGRRCYDDERQINRWNKYAGEKSGRYRRRLINMCIKNNTTFNDTTISPVIRQGLLHWAYELNKKDFDKHKRSITIYQQN